MQRIALTIVLTALLAGCASLPERNPNPWGPWWKESPYPEQHYDCCCCEPEIRRASHRRCR
jgi:hypothetical protein